MVDTIISIQESENPDYYKEHLFAEVPTIPWMAHLEDHALGQELREKFNDITKKLEEAINRFKQSGMGDKGHSSDTDCDNNDVGDDGDNDEAVCLTSSLNNTKESST